MAAFAAAAAPIIGAALDSVSSAGSGLFNINQARKNRAFQERMYYQQLKDNRENWNMMNDYNHPLAVRQRMELAGLNPLLMYGDGGSSLQVANTAQGASAPSGSMASGTMQTQFAQAAAQSALINAQIRNIEADTQSKLASAGQSEATTSNLQYDLMFKKLSQNVELALKHGNLDQIFAATDNLRQQAYSTGQMTLQSTLTMMQARQYEIKRFNLDANTIGEQLAQKWYELESGRIVANSSMKSAFAAVLNAKANWNLSNAQIGQIALNMSQSREMFPLLKENMNSQNKTLFWNRVYQGVQMDNEKKRGFQLDVDNYLRSHGVGPDSYFYRIASPFILPTIKLNDDLFGRPQYQPIKYN